MRPFQNSNIVMQTSYLLNWVGTWCTSSLYNMNFNLLAIVHHSTQKNGSTNSLSNGKGSLASCIGKVIEQVKFSTSILLWHPRDFATKHCAPLLTPHFQKLLSPKCENSPQKKKEKKSKPCHLFVLFWCEFVMSARIVVCKHSDLRFVGALLLLLSWKHPDLQFLVGFLVVGVVETSGLAIFGRIGVVVQKFGTLQFGRIVVVVEILGLAIWSDCCLVGLKTHFQNLKLFSCCPVTRC